MIATATSESESESESETSATPGARTASARPATTRRTARSTTPLLKSVAYVCSALAAVGILPLPLPSGPGGGSAAAIAFVVVVEAFSPPVRARRLGRGGGCDRDRSSFARVAAAASSSPSTPPDVPLSSPSESNLRVAGDGDGEEGTNSAELEGVPPESVVVTVPPSSVESLSTEDVPPPRFSDASDEGNDEGVEPDGVTEEKKKKKKGPPSWMKCVNAVAPRTMPLNEAVAGAVDDLTLCQANELIEMGAVWARMDLLNEEDIMEQYYSGGGGGDDAWTVDGSGKVQYADLPKGWGGGEHQFAKFVSEEEDLEEYVERMNRQRYRRVMSPTVIEAGTDMRIYPRPRRFPACYELSDGKRLLYEDTTFVVVDKPPMLPTQPDASNYRECCPGCVNDLMGPFTTVEKKPVRRPLLCHRVDSVVGGCVVLSKDGYGQKVFAKLQRERKLKKLYLTLTTEPVPLGRHVHWMWAPANARGQMGGPPCQFVSHAPPESRRKARENWIRCVLEVVRCEEIEVAPDDEEGHGYVPPPGVKHYQTTIRLVTGRKHQVRAQLSSLGSPIVRDTLYGPIAGLTLDTLGDDEESEMEMDDAVAKVRIPSEPIGLQAHAILFGGVRAKAGTPWWGDRVVGSAEAEV